MNHMTAKLTSAICFLVMAVSTVAFPQAKVPAPPPTRQDNVREMIHGVEIIDPYRWLENQGSGETRKWEAEQNAYMHSVLDPVPALPAIRKRMKEIMEHDSISPPAYRNGYYFFYRWKVGEDFRSLFRRKGIAGKDELVLDPHSLSADHTTSIQSYGISLDGRMMVYGVRRGGEDEVEIHVMDIEKHRILPDALPRTIYTGAAWKKDLSGFFYGSSARGEVKKIYFHTLGTDPVNDREIFAGSSPNQWISPTVSANGRYLAIDAWIARDSSELYIQDLSQNGPVHPLITGIDAAFEFTFAGDSIVLKTNWKAPTGRVIKIDLANPDRDHWREIVPASEETMEDVTAVGGKLFVTYLHNVTSQISIFSLDGNRMGQVDLPPAVSAGIRGRYEEDEGVLSFSSFTTPVSYFRFSASSGKRELWYREPVKSDPNRYVSEQVWYPSKDGTRIPMFLVYRKGLKLDGKRPVLLNGYGGYGLSQTPGFSEIAVWWADHGGVYALANIRGGGEFGEKWHLAGKLDKKQNVFDDFIAGAEWLIKSKHTNPEKLAIWGASNGGLLVGAVTTQRPELFRAVVCEHSDLDIVRYPQFTKNNISYAVLEYGNATDPEQFKFVYAYSPYQHVKPDTKYPAMLFTSGDADTRVPPEQARKMVARTQAATSSGLPVLLIYDINAGHSGGRPYALWIEEQSLKLAFLASQLDMK
jgi:prolyl oligopeptidase